MKIVVYIDLVYEIVIVVFMDFFKKNFIAHYYGFSCGECKYVRFLCCCVKDFRIFFKIFHVVNVNI